MRKLVVLLIIGAIGWQTYGKFRDKQEAWAGDTLPVAGQQLDTAASSSYSCDGRTHCSQMTSCAEATWFLQHCPGTKMDGNNDGIPCEKQWCR
ncbi:excalibur calcium-binding domain-containing protein [Azovibrio restrictus]|uniref:excalibur calcium-binding domain-containing protein n=1 Tax=Azovibrio restrictus TaxID=146938 RepID=UPI0009FE6CCD|nr:excalibur calcium-binding domain-containing protein [Azovibrio restrictus]